MSRICLRVIWYDKLNKFANFAWINSNTIKKLTLTQKYEVNFCCVHESPISKQIHLTFVTYIVFRTCCVMVYSGSLQRVK